MEFDNLNRNMNYFITFLKGVAMGAADVVPGVSVELSPLSMDL